MYLYGDSDLERYKNLKKSFKLGFCKSMEVMKSKEQEVVIDREDLQ